MTDIHSIQAFEILDAKGNPTVEANVTLSNGISAQAACPAGTSIGTYEAVELRDHDEMRFRGLGVLKAIENINTLIAPKLIGMDATKQQEIDRTIIDLDATPNKAHLGANAMLAVSMAVAKAGAMARHLPLYLYLREYIQKDNLQLKIPIPIFNVINGGKHAGQNTDMQEFQVIPASFKTYEESLQIAYNVYKGLADVLSKSNLSTLVGDEGGYGPILGTNEEALAKISEAVVISNLRLGYDVFLGLDCASNNYFVDKKYKIKDREQTLNSQDIITFYQEIVKKYHILYLEDALSEDDFDGWSILNQLISGDTIISGDDLTTTNPSRLQMALDKKAISGIIIKPNQIGTVIETLAVVVIARQAGLKIIVSHRSGETNDDFIADFAVGVSADYIKCGAPARGERIAKYNRLLAIERQIKNI